MTIITTTIPAPTPPDTDSARSCDPSGPRCAVSARRPGRSYSPSSSPSVSASSQPPPKPADGRTPLRHPLDFDPTNLSLTGILFGQLMIGILGVLVVSAEYGTGTIRASLAAVPDRPLFLVAKATTFAIVAFLVGEFVSFVAFFVGQSLISGGAPHATITQSGVLGAVIGSGLYLTVLGLLAVGLG